MEEKDKKRKKKEPQGAHIDIIKEIKARERSRAEIQHELQLIESQIQQQRRLTHSALFQKFSEKAGLQIDDVQEIWEEIRRRQKVQRRFVMRSHEKIRSRSIQLVKEGIARRKAIRKQYLKLHADKYKAREGNPELKFYVPIDHWENVLETPNRGLISWGFREPDMGEWSHERDMDIDYEHTMRGHSFYPKAYVRTGDIETPMTLRFQQVVVMKHDPLESDRGDFRVDRVRVDFSGVGHSRARMGDTCPLEMGHNIWDTTELSLAITAHQYDYEAGILLEDSILRQRLLAGTGTHDNPVEIDLGTSPVSHDVLLDNNGAEIWLYIVLTTRVSAGDEDGYSELNFSRDDTEGLRLGCISLVGEYL